MDWLGSLEMEGTGVGNELCEGEGLTDKVGADVGSMLGTADAVGGDDTATSGMSVGSLEIVGDDVGINDGAWLFSIGSADTEGMGVNSLPGAEVGVSFNGGLADGFSVGRTVGWFEDVGLQDGVLPGDEVGEREMLGLSEGSVVGIGVGSSSQIWFLLSSNPSAHGQGASSKHSKNTATEKMSSMYVTRKGSPASRFEG